MSELTIQIIAFLKLLCVGVFAFLYAEGGRQHEGSGKGYKWIRRYIATFILTAGVIGFALWDGTFNWWLLLYYPLLYTATTWGYGANGLFERLWHRFVQGLFFTLAAIPIAVATGQWALFTAHAVICIGSCVLLGTFSLVQSRTEEFLIGVGIGLIPLFLV